LNNEFYDDYYSYSKEQMREIFAEILFPPTIVINPGTDSCYNFNGIHAFLYFMWRIKVTNNIAGQASTIWGYDYSVLSKVMKEVHIWMDSTHSFRLTRLQLAGPRLSYFNERIRTKLTSNGDDINNAPAATRTALFSDGVRVRACKPSVHHCIYFILLNLKNVIIEYFRLGWMVDSVSEFQCSQMVPLLHSNRCLWSRRSMVPLV